MYVTNVCNWNGIYTTVSAKRLPNALCCMSTDKQHKASDKRIPSIWQASTNFCLTVPYYLLDTCLTLAWHLLDTCRHLLDPFLTPAWHLLGTRLTPAWHLLDTCWTPAWHLIDTCLVPAWHLLGTCLTDALHQAVDMQHKAFGKCLTETVVYGLKGWLSCVLLETPPTWRAIIHIFKRPLFYYAFRETY